MKTANETLTKCVGDMHALVTHGLKAVGRQLENLREKSMRHPEAYSALQEIERTLKVHCTMLDARLNALGGSSAQPVKDVVSAVSGYVSGLISAVGEEEASKSLRDDYTFLSNVSIGYLMLDTTGAGLSDRETSALAEAGYRDTARLIKQIDRITPTVVIQELREDGLAVTDVSQQAATLVKSVWERAAQAVS